MEANPVDTQFLEQLNNNLGIVHKVSRIYCDDFIERQDLFQEIIFQLWRSYPQFKGESKISTWMYQVALNTAITHFRKERRRTQHLVPAEQASNVQTDSKDGLLEERIEMLYEGIHALSRVDKMIVLLRLEEQGYEEIARLTGLTKVNVGVRLVRIKKQLELRFQNKH